MKVKTICQVEREVDLNIIGARLPSIETAKKLPDRLVDYITDQGQFSWWWATGNKRYAYICAYRTFDPAFVCFPFTVRPVLIIGNLKKASMKIGDLIYFGGKEFEVISEKQAFCTSDIGEYVFKNNKDLCATDAARYEDSDVKKYIDEWFEKNKEEIDA